MSTEHVAETWRVLACEHIRVVAAEDGVWGIDVHGTWMPFEGDTEAMVREIAEDIREQQARALHKAAASAEGYRRRLSQERENHLLVVRQEVAKRQEAEAEVARLKNPTTPPHAEPEGELFQEVVEALDAVCQTENVGSYDRLIRKARVALARARGSK